MHTIRFTSLCHAAIVVCLALWPACGSRLRSSTRTSSGVIPNLIHFTGPWKPEAVVNGSRKVVPRHTEFRYYDNAQMEQSVHNISQELTKHGVWGAAKAFHELRPMAFKADLWRYMILWQEGGIYLDAKLMLTAPLASWVDQQSDDLALCWDNPTAYSHGGIYWTAILAARKHNPALLSAIKHIISNVEKRYYGEGEVERFHRDLSITGPVLLTRALNSTDTTIAIVPPRANCTWKGNAIGKVVGKDGSQIAEVNREVYEAMHSCKCCDLYGQRFRNHQVYCSEPGPDCVNMAVPLVSLAADVGGKHSLRQAYRSWIV